MQPKTWGDVWKLVARIEHRRRVRRLIAAGVGLVFIGACSVFNELSPWLKTADGPEWVVGGTSGNARYGP